MVFWFFLQTFTFPFLFEQKKPRMVTALRNSFAVLVHVPWLYFITSLFTLTVALIGVILTVPWMFISVGFCMYISIGMLKKTLEAMEAKKKETEIVICPRKEEQADCSQLIVYR